MKPETIVPFPDFIPEFHPINFVYIGQRIYPVAKIMLHFFLRVAVHGRKRLAHGYITQVVQFRENRHLREFGNTRHEHKPQVLVGGFYVDIEAFQHQPNFFDMWGIYIFYQRFVVFVDKNDHFAKVFGVVDQFLKQ